jgi:hypothetical protein
MHIAFGRKSRLTALGAGLITAAALAVSSSGPALADTADTGGTAVVSLTGSFLTSLAKSNVIVLPGTPATSSFATGPDAYTVPVTGGNGEVSIFFGNLELDLFTGALTGTFPGSTRQTALAYLAGDISASSSAGPPATETLSAGQFDLSWKAATALNDGLGTTVLKRGTNIGNFTTTFDVTST